METFTIRYSGDKWKIVILEEDDYVKKLGDDSAGITKPDEKTIYLNVEELNEELVRHEIFHMSYFYTCTSSAGLTDHQSEEVGAEVFAKHGPKLIRLARAIYKKVKHLK